MRSLFFIVLLIAFQLSQSKAIQPQFNTQTATFTENRGQIISTDGKPVPEVKYYSGNTGNVITYFTPTRVSYVFPKLEMIHRPFYKDLPKETLQRDSMTAAITELYRMDVEFTGANPNALITGNELSSEYTNYYMGHCPDGITHVPSFGKLVVKDLYPNIDLVWKTTGQGLKYEFIVHPGGDPSQISMHYTGANISQNPDSITASTPLGRIRDGSPVSFQNGNDIITSFHKTGADYGFTVGEYDKTKTLVIDPMVIWGAYQLGTALDFGLMGMRVDGSGNTIITGGTVYPSAFPASAGAFQMSITVYTDPEGNVSGRDFYVSKFDNTGTRLWGTYFGGTGFEPFKSTYSSNCMAVDGGNNIIVVGATTGGTFPVRNAAQTTFGGTEDMCIFKLTPDGARDWATYYGGGRIDEAWGVTTDPSNNVIVVGWSQSTDFPTTASVFQTSSANINGIGVVVKFNSSGQRQWATYFGNQATVGATYNYLTGVAADNSGNVYFTGSAWGQGYPTTTGTHQPVNDTSFGKITLASLDAGGQRRWASYYGCGIGTDIICDNSNFYVVGTTIGNTLFDVTRGTYIIKGISDICIFSLDKNTCTRNGSCWSQLFGGTDTPSAAWAYGRTDYGQSIAFGPDNDIWVGGLAGNSGDFPVVNTGTYPPWTYDIQQSNKGGNADAFFAQFYKSNGAPRYSSFFGTTGNDLGGYIAMYGASSIIIAANSNNDGVAGTFPIPTERRVGTPYSMMISKICTSYGELADAGTSPILMCSGDTIQIGTSTLSGNKYEWTNHNNISNWNVSNPYVYPRNSTANQIKVIYEVIQTDLASGCYGRDTVEVNVRPGPAFSAQPSQSPQCVGNSVGYSIVGMYTPNTGDRFVWEASGGVVVGNNNQQSVTIKWTSVGIDTVYLRVTNSLGCSVQARLPVEVTALPTVNAGIDPPEICEGSSIKLNATATGGTGAFTYSWTPLIGISAPNILTPDVTPAQPITDYILAVTDARGCIGFDTVRVRMNPKPVAFAGEDKVICAGESVVLPASASGGTPFPGANQYTINWVPATGLSAANVSDPTAKPAATTDYVFYITDAKGCKSFDTVRVTVLPKPNPQFAFNEVDFGKLDGCTSSLEKIDTLENKGTQPIQLLSGISDEPSFSVSSGFPIIIAPGQKVGVKFKYSPVVAAKRSGIITFTGTPCNISIPVNVIGEKLSLAVKTLPTVVDFGQSITCTNKVVDTVITITNTGTDVLTIAQPTILAPYSIIGQTFPLSINVGSNVQIKIHYAPTADGNHSQTIRFPFSAGICKDTIKVSMNGTSFSQTLVLSPNLTNFPSLSGCEISRDTTITLENTSSADIKVDSASGNGMFKIIAPALPVTIKAGEKKVITVQFLPSATGTITDSLVFAYSPCNNKITAQFSGSKQGASFALLDTLDAGEIIACVKNSATVKLAIKNTSSGGAAGGVTTVTSGKNITTNLTNGTSLPNNSPQEFDVTITPPAGNGVFVDSLNLVFNPCGITKTVYVKARTTNVAFKADLSTVDFGKIQSGNNRTIPILFTNTGSTALTISTVPNLLPPFSVKSISPPLPALLQPGEKLTVTVEYVSESGIQTSKVLAFGTVPCPASDSVIIKGEGTLNPQPSLSVTKNLDFGSVCINKDTTLVAQLFNNGGVTLQVQQANVNGNSADFSVKNFTPKALLSGDKMDVQIMYKPSSLGQTSAQIIWVTDLLKDSTGVSGIGKDCGTPPPDTSKTTIAIGNISAEVGQKVKLALILTKQQGLAESGATKFSATMRINQNLVHITDASYPCVASTSPELCDVALSGEYQIGKDTLGFIPVDATLGDVESAPLELVDFQWLNGKGVVTVEKQNGEFKLLNLCREGGVRLYDPNGAVSMSIAPNPAGGNAEIEYSLREETAVKVSLTNILGREVLVIDDAIRKAGTYKQTVDLTTMGDGIYFLMLQCPNTVKTIRMSVVK